MRRDCDEPQGRAAGSMVRRRLLPTRRVGNAVIVARPADGGPVLLPATAAVLWETLEAWGSIDSLCQALVEQYPSVERADVNSTLLQLIEQFESEGLLERS